MIAVVADDFTGAAELGGIGLRYNLNVEINTEVNPETEADLLIIATDTRSKKKQEAERVMEQITRQLSQLQPDLMYKKIDSALRGHILPEITAQLNALGRCRAVVVPANPGLGRRLVNGIYYYYNQPIHLSSFSKDPEFAITTSEVLGILGANQMRSVLLLKSQEPMPTRGIIIAEVEDSRDLKAWARYIDKDTLLAGASEFFSALLETNHIRNVTNHQDYASVIKTPALYVCGSTFHKSCSLVKDKKNKGGPVSYMPEELLTSAEVKEVLYEEWVHEVVSYLHTFGKAIMAIDPAFTNGAPFNPAILREKTAQVVARVFHRISIHELLLEGGSTAWAVLRGLGLHRFYPVQEITPGVIRMHVRGNQGLSLTLKPGSYDWPVGIW